GVRLVGEAEGIFLERDRHADAVDAERLQGALKFRQSGQEEGEVDRVDPPGCQGWVVHARREGMRYGVPDDTEDPRRWPEPRGAVRLDHLGDRWLSGGDVRGGWW